MVTRARFKRKFRAALPMPPSKERISKFRKGFRSTLPGKPFKTSTIKKVKKVAKRRIKVARRSVRRALRSTTAKSVRRVARTL